MEERNGDADPVVSSALLVAANPVAVIAYAGVGQHASLGKARSPRSILHVYHVVGLYSGLAFRVILLVHRGAQFHDFRNAVHAAMTFLSEKHHPFQGGKLPAVQFAARLRTQFGHQLVQSGYEIVIANAVDNENIFAFRTLVAHTATFSPGATPRAIRPQASSSTERAKSRQERRTP